MSRFGKLWTEECIRWRTGARGGSEQWRILFEGTLNDFFGSSHNCFVQLGLLAMATKSVANILSHGLLAISLRSFKTHGQP
jgi:hypothetical protein